MNTICGLSASDVINNRQLIFHVLLYTPNNFPPMGSLKGKNKVKCHIYIITVVNSHQCHVAKTNTKRLEHVG